MAALTSRSTRVGKAPFRRLHIDQHFEQKMRYVIKIMRMPARSRNATPVELALMTQLGARLAAARKERKLAAARMAEVIGVSRNTVRAAEAGDGSVTLGTYMRILTALGMGSDLALVASGAPVYTGSPEISRRHRHVEAEVDAGLRDARSLIAIPKRLAVDSRVSFPVAAFGEPQAW